MPDIANIPLTLTLTGRPLLLYPGVVPELNARLTDAHRGRAERRTAHLTNRALRRAARQASPSPDAAAPATVTLGLPDSVTAPNAKLILNPQADEGDPDSAAPYLAIIEINGPLLNKAWLMQDDMGQAIICMDGYDRIEAAATRAVLDDQCAGLLLAIDSPGGHVMGCFECADALRALDAVKPITAHTDGMMCSGAYAIGAATRRISASLTAYIGSVGVIYGRVDETAKLEQAGIRIDLITSGPQKSWGYPESKMDEAEAAALHTEINQIADMFADRVAATRPLDSAAILALEAGTWMAGDAVTRGLSDATERKDAALETLAQIALAPAPVPAANSQSNPDGTPPTEKEASMKSTLKLRAALSASLLAIASVMATNHPAAAGLDKTALTAALKAETESTVDAMEDDEIAAAAEEDTDEMEDDDDISAMDEDEMDDDEDEDVSATKIAASRIAHAALARVKALSTPKSALTDQIDPATATAIQALPEAKGRDRQAAALSITPGMTVDSARRILGASGKDKTSRLATVPDPKVGAAPRSSKVSPADAAQLANAKAIREKAGLA